MQPEQIISKIYLLEYFCYFFINHHQKVTLDFSYSRYFGSEELLTSVKIYKESEKKVFKSKKMPEKLKNTETSSTENISTNDRKRLKQIYR